MSNETMQCCKRIYPAAGPFSGRRCTKKATVEHDGKWYCGTHSPEAKAKRDEKWNRIHAQKAAALRERFNREELEQRKARAFDVMTERGWWVDGNLEFEGEYVCLKRPNDIVGRSRRSRLDAVEDAMAKEGL